MPIAPDDVVRVDVLGQFSGADQIVNAYQLQNTSANTVTDAQIEDNIEEWIQVIYTILRGLMTALTVWRFFRVENITQQVVYGEFPITGTIPGTAAGEPGAPGVCGLAYFNTGIAHVQMRKYWGVLAETHIGADGTIGGGGTGIMANAIAQLLIPQATTNAIWEYGYFSPKTSAFQVPTAGVFTNIPSYQRRRRQGRGL